MQFILYPEVLSLTIPAPSLREPENFNSRVSHLNLKWAKMELKTLLSILLFINSSGLPLAFMILYRKSLASAGFLLIYASISKNSYWLFSLTEDVAHEMCQNNDSGKWSHRLDKAPREWAALHTSLVPTSVCADPAVTRITWGGAWHSLCPLNLFCVAIGVITVLWTFVLEEYISHTNRLLTFSNCKLREDFYWCAGDKRSLVPIPQSSTMIKLQLGRRQIWSPFLTYLNRVLVSDYVIKETAYRGLFYSRTCTTKL